MTISNGAGSKNIQPAGSATAALRKVMDRSLGRSLGRSKPKQSSAAANFGAGALSDMLSRDPINDAIESEIIPRLMMVHSSPADQTDAAAADKLSLSVQASDFAALPLHLEAGELLDHIDGLIKAGIGFDTICVEVLAPAARRLGDMWCEDECDFVDVTMGLWRLQEVMRELSARTPGARPQSVIPGTALFAPMPGDTHAFGAQMIEEIFAKHGWLSELIVKPQRRELLDRMSRKPFDLVCLTITRDFSVSAIASLIKTMRGISANPDIAILIGGNMVNANPGLVDDVLADGTASDAKGALKLAENLVEASPARKALTLR